MEALILSCSTGGGHNAAGRAVKQELERRGHRVTMLDPYALTGWEDRVAGGYVHLAQKSPRLFGCVYQLGDWYRNLPIHSPVYGVNQAMCGAMERYLDSHRFDLILMPHIYPGEILTCMKNRGISIPKTIFIATDYVCIPFTEEIDCDYYVTPSPELNDDFLRRGIPREKLVPAGIPVRPEFSSALSRADARRQLGLENGKRYLLLSGGSIGAGEMEKSIAILKTYLDRRPACQVIAICGSNAALYARLKQHYGSDSRITLLPATPHMALYMRACDVFLSKPGGLSSTEAAVLGVPLIHVSPIPGCESRNMKFFDAHGMSLAVGSDLCSLPAALDQIQDPDIARQMQENQRLCIPRSAAGEICALAEKTAQKFPVS